MSLSPAALPPHRALIHTSNSSSACANSATSSDGTSISNWLKTAPACATFPHGVERAASPHDVCLNGQISSQESTKRIGTLVGDAGRPELGAQDCGPRFHIADVGT